MILARYARSTEVVTAEHHPNDHGPHFYVNINGGRHHGTEIRCCTADSAIRLFDVIVAARKKGESDDSR
jgi:hypothetical protein